MTIEKAVNLRKAYDKKRLCFIRYQIHRIKQTNTNLHIPKKKKNIMQDSLKEEFASGVFLLQKHSRIMCRPV